MLECVYTVRSDTRYFAFLVWRIFSSIMTCSVFAGNGQLKVPQKNVTEEIGISKARTMENGH